MKKIISLLLIITMLMPITAIAAEDSISLNDIFTNELSHINYSDCKQPHSSWAFSSEEKDEITDFFKTVAIEPAEINDSPIQQYELDVFTTNDTAYLVRIYDNGIVTRETRIDSKIDLCCRITDFEYFKSIMDRYFTTQSTGYGRAMPGKQQTLEISNWAESYYEKAKEYNLLPPYMTMGYMTDNITREQFCDIAVNLLADFPADESTEKAFEDTINPNILRLADKGMILGKSDTKFSPNDYITREEAATILSRLAIVRMEGITTTDEYIIFDDSDQISRWADNSIQTICKIGIMQGVGGNRFAPQEGYTIEQALTTAVRLYEYFSAYAPKPGPYTYETPYGTVITEKNASSWVNFAIECDAVVGIVKDWNTQTETTYMLDKPVKAFTDGMGSQYISFDTFADIFDGEWELTDGVFEFAYDDTKEIDLKDFVPVENPKDAEWPNKTDSIDVLYFAEMASIKVNGVETELHGHYGGRITKSSIMMYDGQLYIHVQMVAELLGGEIGTLSPIL